MLKRLLFASATTVLLSASFAAGATYGPRVIGTGYLSGWTVLIHGDEVCDDPYIWDGTHEIECD